MSINNFVRICVDQLLGGDVYGRFYTAYDFKPTTFMGSAELLLKMERFYDRLGFPMSTTRPRSFNGIITGKEVMNVEGLETLLVPQGEKASFLVRVIFRQNSSMQGTLRWVEGNKEANFRSALELMRFLESTSSISSIWDESGVDDATYIATDIDAAERRMTASVKLKNAQ